MRYRADQMEQLQLHQDAIWNLSDKLRKSQTPDQALRFLALLDQAKQTLADYQKHLAIHGVYAEGEDVTDEHRILNELEAMQDYWDEQLDKPN